MDYAAQVLEEAKHLAWMASLPGELALDQAKLREEQLIASHPMYAGLPELIRQERARMREESSHG